MATGASRQNLQRANRDAEQPVALPQRPSELSQLWHEVLRPWFWPLIALGVLFGAIYRHGAEVPLDTAAFAAISSCLLVLALIDKKNQAALAKVPNPKWALIGLVLVWLVMAAQLLPIPFLTGGNKSWFPVQSVTVDVDLTLRAMVSMGSAVAFFVFGAIFGADRERREIVLWLLGVLTFSVIMYAFMLHSSGLSARSFQQSGGETVMEGPFLNANTFAILMVMVFSVCLGTFVAEDRRHKGKQRLWVRVGAVVLAAAAAVCIFLTMSRAAWILSLGIIFGLALIVRPGAHLRTSIFGVAALLVLFIGWNASEQLGLSIQPLDLAKGFDGRFADWEPGLDLTLTRPVLGWGAGTFARAMEPFRDAPQIASSMIVITPQNSILLITSETGLIGMVAWGVLLTGIVLFAVNGLKVRSSSPVLAVSLLLGASAAIAQSLVDFPMSIPAIAAFWAFLLGYCGGLGGKARRKKRRNRPEASNNQSGRFSRQRISA